MINITFTCRITCKQVNKDCFFKIPVLRLSYFYKGKSSNICNSVMILYYPYVTLSKQLPYQISEGFLMLLETLCISSD